MVKLKIRNRTIKQKFMIEWTGKSGMNCGARLQDINYIKFTKGGLVYINGKFAGSYANNIPIKLNIDVFELTRLYDVIIDNNVDLNIYVEYNPEVKKQLNEVL